MFMCQLMLKKLLIHIQCKPTDLSIKNYGVVVSARALYDYFKISPNNFNFFQWVRHRNSFQSRTNHLFARMM